MALIGCILAQVIWIVGGVLTHWDPYPFVFLLTCSNVLQLVLIFVIAVGQRSQDDAHQAHFYNLHEHLDEVHRHLAQIPEDPTTEGMLAYVGEWVRNNQHSEKENTRALAYELADLLLIPLDCRRSPDHDGGPCNGYPNSCQGQVPSLSGAEAQT